MPATAPPTFASLFDWRLPFSPLGSFAPNPGWTFGNVVINTTNSRAPQVEQAILGKLSYGRQLGKVIEAVEVLCASLTAEHSDPRITAFQALADEVREIKQSMAGDRLLQLKRELEDLRAQDPAAWRKLVRSGG
ncbi:hypothetical protein ACSFA2_20990 [Variovorax sp. LT2P21]|uniref:hypothetical protein n=1 Tax=Variovorax sp. LT2P21 TaxID=3443731 RepID=UPI003F447FE9